LWLLIFLCWFLPVCCSLALQPRHQGKIRLGDRCHQPSPSSPSKGPPACESPTVDAAALGCRRQSSVPEVRAPTGAREGRGASAETWQNDLRSPIRGVAPVAPATLGVRGRSFRFCAHEGQSRKERGVPKPRSRSPHRAARARLGQKPEANFR